MAEPKPSCLMEVCGDVMSIFEAHYGHVPHEETKLLLVQRKFAAFKDTLIGQGFQCDEATCLAQLGLSQRLSLLGENHEDSCK